MATAADAKAAPREFALYTLAECSKEKLESIAKQYGNPEKATLADTAFASVKEALHRGCTHEADGSGDCLAFAAHTASAALAPFRLQRPAVGPDDIRIQITHCGMCHSDLHQIRGEWGNTSFPLVAGHEIVGVVTEVGSNVTEFKVGEHAGIGCMMDSCRKCEQCLEGDEQYCTVTGPIWTYNSTLPDGTLTQGGYSTHYVLDKRYALHVPDNLPLDAAAPLLCAGITTYSPLRYFGLDKPGMKIGVVGLGGLGHMAVKWAKAFGCQVTVISTSPKKKAEAIERLGADSFVVSRSEEEMAAAAGSLHGIIDTVSAKHDINSYMKLLRPNGKFVVVGLPPEPFPTQANVLVGRRITLAGSLIGSIKETQEMLDFAGKHNITCEVEVVDIDYVNTALERMEKNDVHYRFVIDVAGSLVA